MKQKLHTLEIRTAGKSLVSITRPVLDWVAQQGITTGLLTLWCRHTSASLTVQENADPAVRQDILAYFERLAPECADYIHDDEGPDDMPAHLRSAMTRTSEVVPITNGRLALGTWQALYLWEHRRAPHTRSCVVHVQGV